MSRTAETGGRQEHDPAEKEHERDEAGTTQVRTNRTDAATGWPARASANPHSLSTTSTSGKPTTRPSATAPLRLNEIQELAHATASSSTENSSTEPMPRTSARVAGPKATSSRTRS